MRVVQCQLCGDTWRFDHTEEVGCEHRDFYQPYVVLPSEDWLLRGRLVKALSPVAWEDGYALFAEHQTELLEDEDQVFLAKYRHPAEVVLRSLLKIGPDFWPKHEKTSMRNPFTNPAGASFKGLSKSIQTFNYTVQMSNSMSAEFAQIVKEAAEQSAKVIAEELANKFQKIYADSSTFGDSYVSDGAYFSDGYESVKTKPSSSKGKQLQPKHGQADYTKWHQWK